MAVAAAFKSLLLVMLVVGLVTLLNGRPRLSKPRLPAAMNELEERVRLSGIPQLRENVFDLAQFGGVGDGFTLNTHAFEEAVAAILNAGGGQLNVHPGIWLTAPFNLTSNMTLFLARGAVIKAVQNASFWPVLPPLPSYGTGQDLPGPRYGSLIHGEKLDNVVITGHNGTIDGQGQRWWQLHERGLLQHTRGSLIEFLWCSNFEVSNINLMNSPFWTLHPYDSRNFTIRLVNVLTPEGAPDTAGIVLDSCRDVSVEKCNISVGDDCISIKSGWDQYGIEHGQPSANIFIHDVMVRSYASAGVSIGSEMSGGVNHVFVKGLRVSGSKVGVLIKTTPGRGGHVKNIRYSDIVLEDVEVGVVINTFYGGHPDSLYNPADLPVVSNISYYGFYGRRVMHFARMYGTAHIPVREVEFKDIFVLPGPRKRSSHTFRCSFRQGKAIGRIFPRPCEALALTEVPASAHTPI